MEAPLGRVVCVCLQVLPVLACSSLETPGRDLSTKRKIFCFFFFPPFIVFTLKPQVYTKVLLICWFNLVYLRIYSIKSFVNTCRGGLGFVLWELEV